MSSYGVNTTAMRVCPVCKGTGINPVATYMVCPKCNGECCIKWPDVGSGGAWAAAGGGQSG